MKLGALLYPDFGELDRPRTRGECKNGVRPCPYVGCKYHLYLDVNPGTGSIKLNFPDREPEDMIESCALDVADQGSSTLEEIGFITNLTRERIRQIEMSLGAKLGDNEEARSLLTDVQEANEDMRRRELPLPL